MAEMVFVDAILASAILSAAPPLVISPQRVRRIDIASLPRPASPCLEPTVRFQRILAWNGPVKNFCIRNDLSEVTVAAHVLIQMSDFGCPSVARVARRVATSGLLHPAADPFNTLSGQ
jgi:hypothetical protein